MSAFRLPDAFRDALGWLEAESEGGKEEGVGHANTCTLTVGITRHRLSNYGHGYFREFRIDVRHIDGSEWHVWRRYAQFDELRGALRREARTERWDATSKAAVDAPLPPKREHGRILFAACTPFRIVAGRAPALGKWLAAIVADGARPTNGAGLHRAPAGSSSSSASASAGARTATAPPAVALTSPSLLAFLGLATLEPSHRRTDRACLHVRLVGAPTAESGDLVLFRTRDRAVPALQRLATRSRWDHVGILLFLDHTRTRVRRAAECTTPSWRGGGGGEVGVLECDSAGTKFYPLRSYELSWHQQYDEIALRPLEWSGRGSEAAIATLQRWYDEVLGAPYELTLGKIIGGSGKRPPAAAADAGAEAASGSLSSDSGGGAASAPPLGFFCSELVAHAYQALGVLPPERPAAGFWPVDFGEAPRKELPLLLDARLGDEIPIEFTTPAVAALPLR